ncbi:MAG: hypothetical protein QOH66_1340 [Actinomycetota bacterium]|nr:hypothetical protein [Actinomycetota bacterium]
MLAQAAAPPRRDGRRPLGRGDRLQFRRPDRPGTERGGPDAHTDRGHRRGTALSGSLPDDGSAARTQRVAPGPARAMDRAVTSVPNDGGGLRRQRLPPGRTRPQRRVVGGRLPDPAHKRAGRAGRAPGDPHPRRSRSLGRKPDPGVWGRRRLARQPCPSFQPRHRSHLRDRPHARPSGRPGRGSGGGRCVPAGRIQRLSVRQRRLGHPRRHVVLGRGPDRTGGALPQSR